MYKLQSTNLVVLLLMMLHFVIYIELKNLYKETFTSHLFSPNTLNTVLNLHFMIGHLLNCLNKVPSLTLTPAYERTG